jgi:AP2 domain/HNH endonuclease
MERIKVKVANSKINRYALVDAEDFARINSVKWYLLKNRTKRYATARPSVLMHRLIMNPSKVEEVDHIDGNGLNNQKKNLRICSHSKNLRNRGKQLNNTSGFKGVYRPKTSKTWRAQITVNRKQMHLGSFNNKEDAYAAYCEACLKYHGEYGKV